MDKYSGGLALGAHGHGVGGANIEAALETALIGDVLQACDSDGAPVHLHVGQDPDYGGVRLTLQQETEELHANAIARSQMHSMLADRARCAKYAAALAASIKPDSHVLDIGAGTGLLALLAARSGAAHVTAVEMYPPLAKLAARIVVENGFEDKVTVHAAPSTALVVGEDAQLPRRADILVTEIFDSALLGEACIPSIAHAHEHLLMPDAKVIPARARMYASVVHSDLFRSFHHLGEKFPFHRSANGTSCIGGNTGTPVHLNALSEDYRNVTDMFEVFGFDFSKDCVSLSDHCGVFNVPRTATGRADAVITWWELDLLEDGSVSYSTAPGAEPWQDHWLPVVYPLPGLSTDESSPTITISAGHDTVRVWFSANDDARGAPFCSCGFHALPGGASRVAELADQSRCEALRKRIGDAMSEAPGPVLDASDGSVCALLAADELIRKGTSSEIMSLESHTFSQHLYSQAARRGNAKISFLPSIAETMEMETKFAVVLSEPYYHACLNRPVQMFANLLVQVQALRLSKSLADNARFVPARAELVARVVRFRENEDPFVRAPAVVAGVKHASFAKLCAAASPNPAHMHLPLYMHAHKAESAIVLGTADFAAPSLQMRYECTLGVPTGKGQAAVALHVRYDAQPPPRMSHDLVLPLPLLGSPDNSEVSLHAEWDASDGQWRFEVIPVVSISASNEILPS